jgi:sigma-B regulation protein RsbU (phosphoserine phosphatase)
MRVLIADDDPVNRRLLERTLQQWGYEVTVARDGAEAWRLFQERDYPFVISDWIMPSMDGLELVRRIRGSPRPGYVFIILVAAATERQEVVQGLGSGADDFMSKPFNRAELQARLRSGERIIRLEQALVERNRILTERNTEMEQDLRMACEVQQALLPQGYPSFPANVPPERSALRFCDRYRPNGAVGGDFFDILALSDTCAGVFICDVMGHGVRAALVTAMVRALLQGVRATNDPGRMLAEMNGNVQSIFAEASIPVFLSAFYATIDTTTGQFTYANAGHPAPLFVQRSRNGVMYLPPPGGKPGPPLGVRDHVEYAVETMTLATSDVLILFTDGLFDVAGEDQDLFDEEALRQVVTGQMHLSGPQLIDHVLSEVLRFSAGRGFADDVCLLGMEVMSIRSDRID